MVGLERFYFSDTQRQGGGGCGVSERRLNIDEVVEYVVSMAIDRWFVVGWLVAGWSGCCGSAVCLAVSWLALCRFHPREREKVKRKG